MNLKKVISFLFVAVISLQGCGGSSSGYHEPTPEPEPTVPEERINKNGRYWALHPDEYEFWRPVTGGKVIKSKDRENNHWMIIKKFISMQH